MRCSIRHINLLFLGFTIVFLSFPFNSHAFDWSTGLDIDFHYRELTGPDAGKAEITTSMKIPVDTPLLARQVLVDAALRAFRQIWSPDDPHSNITGKLGNQIPPEIQTVASKMDGSSFVLALMDAFEAVQNTGFSRFQHEYQVVSVEKLNVPTRSGNRSGYPDSPLSYDWSVNIGTLANDQIREKLVMASLVSYTASILSFRSEFRRFPASLAELRETGHLLFSPINPYNGQIVKEVTSVSPGNITYNIINNNTVALLTYVSIDGKTDVIRREINSSGSFDYLYRQTAGLSAQDKQVARYSFQISQIINEYYYEKLDLPYNVPQCALEGFAYVAFDNPYNQRDAKQASNLAGVMPGDFTYHRVSEYSFYLVGYGAGGAAIFSFTSDFGMTGPQLTPMSVQ